MATILLQVAGAAVGGIFGPVGTAIGSAIGATVGGMLDSSLLNSNRTVAGRGLSGARIPSADEGSPVLRVHGTMRIAGALIWATRFEETVTRERQGGKGRGPTVESYHYHANLPSVCAKARSLRSAGSGPMAANSISKRWTCGSIADRPRNCPIP
jgi:hypothetical protein